MMYVKPFIAREDRNQRIRECISSRYPSLPASKPACQPNPTMLCDRLTDSAQISLLLMCLVSIENIQTYDVVLGKSRLFCIYSRLLQKTTVLNKNKNVQRVEND